MLYSMTIRLVAISLLFTGAALCDAKADDLKDSPSATLKHIQDVGAKAFLREFSGDMSKFGTLLEHIGRGNSDWLKVANEIIPATDAIYSETLEMALGEAVEHHPDQVFLLVPRLDVAPWSVEEVCTSLEIDDENHTDDLDIARLERRVVALRKISRSPLANRCGQAIEAAIHKLKRKNITESGTEASTATRSSAPSR